MVQASSATFAESSCNRLRRAREPVFYRSLPKHRSTALRYDIQMDHGIKYLLYNLAKIPLAGRSHRSRQPCRLIDNIALESLHFQPRRRRPQHLRYLNRCLPCRAWHPAYNGCLLCFERIEKIHDLDLSMTRHLLPSAQGVDLRVSRNTTSTVDGTSAWATWLR
jgi:hypothetical protein